MRRPCITINAAMLASTIRVNADLKSDVRTLIVRNNRLGRVAKKLCLSQWPVFRFRIFLHNVVVGKIDMKFLETVSRTPGSAASVNRFATLRRLFDYGAKLFLGATHMISSHEHIRVSRAFPPQLPRSSSGPAKGSWFATVRDRRYSRARIPGGVVEWLMAPVLKTGR